MVLQGFHYISWLGWLTGSYFVIKPWGEPRFSWMSFHTFFALIFSVVSLVKWIDYTSKAVTRFQNQSLVDKIMNLCLLIGCISFGIMVKLNFLFRSKRIATFLQDLSTHEKLIEPGVGRVWKWIRFYICFSCFYQVGSSFVLPVLMYHLIPDASLGHLISPYYYVSFFTFGTFPITACLTTAYVYVLVTTFHLLFVAEKCFDDMYQLLRSLCSTSTAPLCNTNKDTTPEVIVQHFSNVSCFSTERMHDSNGVVDRQKLFQKIEIVKDLCQQFDNAVGPFYLIIFVRTVFFLIHSSDAILIGGTDSGDKVFNYYFKLLFGWFHLGFELSQLSIIYVGNYFHQRIAFRKFQLEKATFLLPNSCTEKQTLWELLSIARSWEWKISAGGIFVIDKPLISGVVTTMMTYVVILFQVNLSDPGNLPQSPQIPSNYSRLI